jgi:hypothetical protein
MIDADRRALRVGGSGWLANDLIKARGHGDIQRQQPAHITRQIFGRFEVRKEIILSSERRAHLNLAFYKIQYIGEFTLQKWNGDWLEYSSWWCFARTPSTSGNPPGDFLNWRL